jgi:hypothetical protein
MPVKHGAYSERLVSAAAAEVRDEVLAEAPWIEDSDPRLARLCRAIARPKHAERLDPSTDSRGGG